MKWILTLVVTAVVLLHQDFWLWCDSRLVLGFVPVGLAYHLVYSILAALTIAVLVRYAWPHQLEVVEEGFQRESPIGTEDPS